MTRARFRTTALIMFTVFWAASGCWPASVSAQAPPGSRPQGARPAPESVAAPASVVVGEQDAKETLQQLELILSRYPPALGRVLKLDPTLLGSAAYLAPYPALAEFLARHPEVGHNPGYFLAFVRGAGDYTPEVRSESAVLWQQMTQGLAVGVVFITVMGTFAWLVRLLVDYRRWSRLAKVQADAHNKLLDRFSANDELLAYIQTPAGGRFLESAPIALDPGHRALSAPFGRILWSIQAGLVLAAAGLGLQFVSTRVQDQVSEPIFALGVLGLALGTGFVISALVAYVLSRRLGLFEAAAAVGSERRESSGT